MKNLRYIAFFIGLLSGISCQSKKIFSDNELRILYFDAEYQLEGEVFLDNEYGILDLIAVDDFLVLTSVKREHVFSLYGSNGEKLGSFGFIGRGPNELQNCRYTGQKEKDTLGSKIWINDVSNSSLKLINLDSSLTADKLIIDKIIPSLGRGANCYYANDSLLYIESQLEANYEMTRYNYLTGKSESEELYGYQVANPFSFYKSIWRKHPSLPLMVSAMHSLNRINFLYMEDGGRKSLCIGKDDVDYEDAIDKDTGLEKRTYYCDLVVSENNIYALWMDQAYDDAYEIPQSQEIHIFDWEGHPIARLIVPEYILKFTIDNDRNILYGMTEDEIIYRYRLPEII